MGQIRSSKKGRATWSVFFTILLVFGSCSLIIWLICPLSILTCRYVETKQVNCQLQQRIGGVIPLWKTPITHLQRAYVNSETKTRTDEDGRPYNVSIYEVRLVSASGEVELGTCFFDDEPGISARKNSERINDFLNTPTNETLVIWQIDWLLFLVGGILLIFPVLALIDVVVGLHTVVGFYQKVKLRS